MKTLQFVTLTGIDDQTSLSTLRLMASQHPLAEFGILYTGNPRGRPRYPEQDWIEKAAATLEGRCALHVCGETGRELLFTGQLARLLWRFPRVQINGALRVHQVERICGQWPGTTWITQTRGNGELVDVEAQNHAILVDASGGRGQLPSMWSRPDTEKAVGFAGGLNPENLPAQFPILRKVARGEWWVDMEQGLRDHQDRFCTRRAQAVLDLCDPA